MTAGPKPCLDFRSPSPSKWAAPRAVADAGGGTIIATAEVSARPERVFQALTTDEVEGWWGHPDFYRMTNWSADLCVCGQWSVVVRFADGDTNNGSGEFAELDPPHKIVMTRKFEKHPLLGTRETTITYRIDPIAAGTRVTVRDEGFIGRGEAAYGNAEHWERVLTWLAAYLGSKRVSNAATAPAKAVVIAESSGASMEAVMAVFPRHKAVVDEFMARGEVIGIGPRRSDR